jgi:hypothetical protein
VTVAAGAGVLPSPAAWHAAARRHATLFETLDPGARIALVPRPAPVSMLLWEAGADGVDTRLEPFPGFSASGADIALAADAEGLAAIANAVDGALFDTLRAGIRAGHIVCYVLRRRCQLEERGFEELLDALGYAFMGACR